MSKPNSTYILVAYSVKDESGNRVFHAEEFGIKHSVDVIGCLERTFYDPAIVFIVF